jgi:Family of unknown function (DUF6496)
MVWPQRRLEHLRSAKWHRTHAFWHSGEKHMPYTHHPTKPLGGSMPEKETIERAQEDAREGKSPSTQAGEFVREEIHHVREGRHGARSPKQAIAIGLSKARRAGVKLSPPPKGTASARKRGTSRRSRRRPSRTRSRATTRALRREVRSSTSRRALSKQARSAAHRRTSRSRSAAAQKAARTRRRSKGSRSRRARR